LAPYIFGSCGIVSNPGPFQLIVGFYIWLIVSPLFVFWHLWSYFKPMPI